MRQIRVLLLSLVATFVAVSLTGCTPKVTVAALEPAEVDRAANLKHVGVLGFGRDSVGLSGKLESQLASYKLKDTDDETYFTVVSRSDLDRILSEQKLQHSGLTDESKMAEVGKLLGAQALISGDISSASSVDTRYTESRTRCTSSNKGKCTSTERYTVQCTKRDTTLGAQIKMVDVSRGDLVTAKTFTESESSKHCEDSAFSRGLKDGATSLEELSNKVASSFVRAISPHYVYFQVELIEKLDVALEKEDQAKFKNSTEFIKAGRNDRATILLSELMASTDSQSYAIAYNLGVMKEASSELEEAKRLYKIADSLTVKPVKPIDAAIKRIDIAIMKHKKAEDQIKR